MVGVLIIISTKRAPILLYENSRPKSYQNFFPWPLSMVLLVALIFLSTCLCSQMVKKIKFCPLSIITSLNLTFNSNETGRWDCSISVSPMTISIDMVSLSKPVSQITISIDMISSSKAVFWSFSLLEHSSNNHLLNSRSLYLAQKF